MATAALMAPPPAESQTRQVYASVLATVDYVVGGANPETGLFRGTGDGEWTHSGWANVRAFAIDVVEAAGGETIYLAGGNGIHKTADGGEFWRLTTGWTITEVLDVKVSPHDTSLVFCATPYGFYRSSDGGRNWEQRNEGLVHAFLTSIEVHRTDPAVLFAAGESGLYRSSDAGASWQLIAFEDVPVHIVVQSPHDPELLLAGTEDEGLFRSLDGGVTWQPSRGTAGETYYDIAFSPDDAAVAFAGGYQTDFFRSEDAGETWRRFAIGIDPQFGEPGDITIHSITVHPDASSIVFVGTNDDGIFRSDDGGVNWRHVGLRGSYVSDLAIR